jgi:hypothetical protein
MEREGDAAGRQEQADRRQQADRHQQAGRQRQADRYQAEEPRCTLQDRRQAKRYSKKQINFIVLLCNVLLPKQRLGIPGA